jgi:hypothetical protein
MNSPVLNIAIGLIFIYTLYSLLVTILNEIVASSFNLRSRLLIKAIDRMLEEENEHYWKSITNYQLPRIVRRIRVAIYNVIPIWKSLDPGKASQSFTDEFYNMPTIKYLGEGKVFNRHPAYISASTFSKTVVDLLQQKGAALKGVPSQEKSDDIRLFLENNSDSISPEIRNELFSLLKALKNDVEKFKKLLTGEITAQQRVELLQLLDTAQNDADKFKVGLQEISIPVEASEAILSLIDKADVNIDALRAYLSTNSFSGITRQVLISASNHAKADAETLRRLVERGNVSLETRQMLLSMFNEAGGKEEKFRLLLENWFNEMMDRAKGWYRRRTKFTTFAFGMLLAIIFNVNTIKIVHGLSSDKADAARLADLAKVYVETNKTNPRFIKDTTGKTDSVVRDTSHDRKNNEQVKKLLRESDSLIKGDIASTNELMGLGWNFNKYKKVYKKRYPDETLHNALDSAIALAKGESWTAQSRSFKNPVRALLWHATFIAQNTTTRDWLGFLITALAISLGAPFWFDLLSKLVQLRGAGDDTDAKKKKETIKAGVDPNATGR